MPPQSDPASHTPPPQASSPDEIALVKFAEQVGLRLFFRDEKTIVLVPPLGACAARPDVARAV